MRRLKATLAAGILAPLLLAGAPAQAAMVGEVVFETVDTVSRGDPVDTFAFQLDMPGTFEFALNDLGTEGGLIEPMSFLGVVLATSSEPVDFLLSPGTFRFDVPDTPQTFFATVVGIPSAQAQLPFGLYGASVTFVPLPAAVLLFGSAILSLLGLSRLRRHTRA